MGNVTYKDPPASMSRMIVQGQRESRPSIGLTQVRGEIYYIRPDSIIPYKNQARRSIDDVSLAELAASIESHGIIQPLQVIPSDEHKGKLEVISGERRLSAARLLGLQTVPCIILDMDKDASEIALIENIQRENLHPIELADAVFKLLEEKKPIKQSEVADHIGISKQKVAHLVAISKLPSDVKDFLLTKKDAKIGFLKTLAFLKDEHELRRRVFKSSDITPHTSVLRMSFDGKTFVCYHSRVQHLDCDAKTLLKEELLTIIASLDV